MTANAIVDVDRIDRQRRLQRGEILIQNAARSGALGIDQRLDILPITVIGRTYAQRDPLDRAPLDLGQIGRKIRVGLVADIDAAGGQGKFAVQVQIACAADLDAPYDQFVEAGLFQFGDVFRDVLVNRPAAQNADIAGLSGGRPGICAGAGQTKCQCKPPCAGLYSDVGHVSAFCRRIFRQ
jgi:hypothetical protein